MATGELYTVTFRFEGAGAGFQTTMSYEQISGTNDENTLTLLAVALGTTLSASFKAVLSNQISFTAIEAFQVTGLDETPGLQRFILPNLGSVVSEALPMGGATVISLLTNAPNAKFNGRLFVSGVPESFQDEGALTAAALTAYGTLGTLLEVNSGPHGPGAAVFAPTVISRFLDKVKRVPPVGFEVLDSSVNPFVKNQRRRNTKYLGVGVTT